MNRILIYTTVFFIPPFMIAIVFCALAIKDVMIHPEPEPLSRQSLKELQKSQDLRDRPGAPNAIILASHSGTQVSELLASYEILKSSKIFDVFVVAPEDELISTTSPLGVFPQKTLSSAPHADLIVVPSVLNPSESSLIRWLKDRADKAKIVVSLGEGASLLARANLLTNRRATTHFVVIEDLKSYYPQITVTENLRYVADGKFITSAGIAATLDAILFAIERFRDPQTAERVSKNLGYTRHPPKENFSKEGRQLLKIDLLRLFFNGGYEWNRQNVGVLTYDGVSEIGLASALDTFPRTLISRVVTFSDFRRPVQTLNGLFVVPTLAATSVPRLDLLIEPPGVPQGKTLLETAEIKKTLQTQPNLVKMKFSGKKGGSSFSEMLDMIIFTLGPGNAYLVAKFAVLGEARSRPSSFLPLSLVIRPIGLGILFVILVWILDEKFFKKRNYEKMRRAARTSSTNTS